MKTPLQELIETFEEMNTGYNPTIDVPLAISLMRSRLEKEKEVMIDFAYKFGDEPLLEIAKWYDKQFNTNEK